MITGHVPNEQYILIAEQLPSTTDPMAPRKATTLSELVDPMSEDEFANTKGDMMLVSDLATENRQPTKKRVNARVAGTATRVTKAKATTRRTSGASLLTAAKNKGKKRAPTEQSDVNKAHSNEIEAASAFDDQSKNAITGDDTTTVAAKPARKRQTKPKSISASQKAPAKGKRAGAAISQTLPPPPESMQIEQIVPEEDEDSTQRAIVKPQAPAVSRSRSLSKQQEPVGGYRHRTGSASSTERSNDPGLRRKLGDITKKFENLDLKYHNLKEVALTEAHSNFEKLRKTTERRAQGSQVASTFWPAYRIANVTPTDQDDIIASLKKELAMQKALIAEANAIRLQLSQTQTENSKLTAENKTLSSTLHDSQAEVKSLTMKLSATRSTSVDSRPNVNVPGSAVKTAHQRANSSQSTNKGQGPAIEKLKEDLYSDLTGLMIRNVKRLDDEDVYDCIQTGRNGCKFLPVPLPTSVVLTSLVALRFHLSISHLPPAPTTPGVPVGYDDMEFAYTPLLDEKNDKDLLEILPDYLTEEICFPRNNAARFYAKVSDCMSRRVEIVE